MRSAALGLAVLGLVPTPIGVGPAYHPPATRLPVRGPACTRSSKPRVGVHLELFARDRVVIVPAGIGVARSCSYPARTRTPTGVIEMAAGRTLTLGRFFELWGQPLGADRLAGFHAEGNERVRAYVDGRRRRGDVRQIPLRPHAQIVLELGAYVPPHSAYRFPKGL
jgi:hypothetical protein